ncbi:MAG: hypothetical protein QXT26_06960 [Thermoproteota archaeon]
MIKLESRFLSIFLLLIVNGLLPLLAEETLNIYVYAEPNSLDSKMLIDHLNNKFKQSVTIYNLNDQNNYGKFLEIVQTLIISIEEQVSPQEGCKICLLSRYAKSYSPSIASFFYNGELSAITVGVIQPETVDHFLNELKANAERGILIIK